MIITVDPAASRPPYEQVKQQVEQLIRRGELAQGTRLPTVRQLAGDLGLAVNTVGSRPGPRQRPGKSAAVW
jgi:DNA-binding transcriptional regulator YhcF (GntR family)